MSLMSRVINYQFKKSDTKRDKSLTTPMDIRRIDDIAYGTHGTWNLLDLYLPRGAVNKLPIIINVHGGGWVYGTKETYQYYLMSLAQRGFAVINPNYRLAPKGRFPAQLEDVNAVVKWVLKNEENYDVDTDTVFLIGDSAGAHLASLYTSLCTHEGYRNLLQIHPPDHFVPSAIVLNCGVYKFGPKDRKKRDSILVDLLGRKDFEKRLELIDVLKYITRDYPPTYVMSSTGDFLLDHVDEIRKVLEEKGIDHVLKIYGDEQLKPPHVFHCDIKSEIANTCNAEQCDFLKKYIKNNIPSVRIEL